MRKAKKAKEVETRLSKVGSTLRTAVQTVIERKVKARTVCLEKLCCYGTLSMEKGIATKEIVARVFNDIRHGTAKALRKSARFIEVKHV